MSNYSVDDFTCTPIQTKHNIIYYVHPLDKSSAEFSHDYKDSLCDRLEIEKRDLQGSLVSTGKSVMSESAGFCDPKEQLNGVVLSQN